MSAVKKTSDFDVPPEIVPLRGIHCGGCGGTYAISRRYYDQCRREGKSWTCPYCRIGWGFAGNSDYSRLQRQNEELKRRAQNEETRRRWAETEAEHQGNRARSYKGHLTRTKKRVGKGTCPCCSRHFQNLQRHMESQHPEYAEVDDA